MDKEKVKFAFQELAEAVKRMINDRIRRFGANRYGVNTLEGSDLQSNMKVSPTDDGIVLEIAEYWMYVSTGWKFKKGEKREEPLIDALIKWAIKKVTSDNEEAYRLAWALWHAMIIGYKDSGRHRVIPARPFLVFDKEGHEEGILTEVMLPELHDYIDKWFDNLFEAIIEDLNNYFNG